MQHQATADEHAARRSAVAAWTVVGICFAVLSVSFAARSLLGLAMPYLQHDFGWSRTFVSSGGSLALVTMAIMSPIAGNLIDRFGARVLLFSGCIAIAIGMTLSGFMHTSWEFLVAFGGFAGLGFGMAATHAVSTIVSLTFDKNRGLAVGTATAGSTAGQLVVVPVLAVVLSSISWRWAYLALGATAFAMAIAVLIFVRPVTARPKQAKKAESRLDLHRDGGPVPQAGVPPAAVELCHLRLHHLGHHRGASSALCGGLRLSAAGERLCLRHPLGGQSGRHGSCPAG